MYYQEKIQSNLSEKARIKLKKRCNPCIICQEKRINKEKIKPEKNIFQTIS